MTAAKALGRIGDRRALGPLLSLFEWWRGFRGFREPHFIEALERALVQFGDQAIEKLERLARKSPAVQHRLFYALSHSRSQRAIQILVEQMSEHSYPIMGLLARMGDEARAHLFYLASDQGAVRGRGHAAWALARNRGAFQEEGDRITDALHHESEQTYLRKKIAFLVTEGAATELDDPVNALIALLQHTSCAKRRAAVDLLAELEADCRACDSATRNR